MNYDDTDNVSDEAVLVSSEITDKQQGLSMQIERKYQPPLDGTPDDFHAFDMWLAKRVATVLVEKYFGYRWKVIADAKQGVVMFNIPELMGATLHFVIRLADYGDLTPEFITRCGGSLLERMRLPRGRIDMAAYAEARHNLHNFDFTDVKS